LNAYNTKVRARIIGHKAIATLCVPFPAAHSSQQNERVEANQLFVIMLFTKQTNTLNMLDVLDAGC
jgi:hypothetical protein